MSDTSDADYLEVPENVSPPVEDYLREKHP